MANFSLIMEAAVDIYKETGSWLLLKWIQINTEVIKMNKSRAPKKIFVVGLKLEVRKMQVINVPETKQFATKKKSWKFMIIFSPNSHFFKKINRQHIPMLLKNAFLVWLTKLKQALEVLHIWVAHSCPLCYWRHTDSPSQWKPPRDLLKKVKKSTAEYDRQNSTK